MKHQVWGVDWSGLLQYSCRTMRSAGSRQRAATPFPWCSLAESGQGFPGSKQVPELAKERYWWLCLQAVGVTRFGVRHEPWDLILWRAWRSYPPRLLQIPHTILLLRSCHTLVLRGSSFFRRTPVTLHFPTRHLPLRYSGAESQPIAWPRLALVCWPFPIMRLLFRVGYEACCVIGASVIIESAERIIALSVNSAQI